MLILVAAIVVVGTVALGVSLLFDKDTPIRYGPSCKSCDIASEGCTADCMLEAAVKAVEYFGDEALDVYKGRASDSYTAAETAQFQQVLESLPVSSLRPWLCSLSLRGVALPDGVKDEYILLTAP